MNIETSKRESKNQARMNEISEDEVKHRIMRNQQSSEASKPALEEIHAL